MNIRTLLPIRTLTVSAFMALATLVSGDPAQAQQPAALPSYATGGETIHGTIGRLSGKYNLYVNDERGFVDHVVLHDGTIINPIGLRLASGMSVTILGVTRDRTFSANEIDTPYTIDYPYPYPAPYYWYGPYAPPPPYWYGPRYGASFRFGGGWR